FETEEIGPHVVKPFEDPGAADQPGPDELRNRPTLRQRQHELAQRQWFARHEGNTTLREVAGESHRRLPAVVSEDADPPPEYLPLIRPTLVLDHQSALEPIDDGGNGLLAVRGGHDGRRRRKGLEPAAELDHPFGRGAEVAHLRRLVDRLPADR